MLLQEERDLDCVYYNILGMFGGRAFQQTVGIPMGTNCAPLLADLFLSTYEADFIQGLLKKNQKQLARVLTERYILHMQVLLEYCYIWMESSQWENWNNLLSRKVSFLTAPHCQFRGVLRSPLVNTSRSIPHSWLITGFVIRLSSPPVFSEVRVTRSLALYVCFVDRCLSFCTFDI
jgi:hypothetical protein